MTTPDPRISIHSAKMVKAVPTARHPRTRLTHAVKFRSPSLPAPVVVKFRRIRK